MALEQLLSQQRESILRRWFELIAEKRSTDGSFQLRDQDQFRNPEAHTVARDIGVLYDELLSNRACSETVCACLDNILKIKAVQDVSPSEAVSFVFLLKEAISDNVGSEIEKRRLLAQWLEFESRVDGLASVAFDVYMHCRERIYDLRVKEIKAARDGAFRLLELADAGERRRSEAAERPA